VLLSSGNRISHHLKTGFIRYKFYIISVIIALLVTYYFCLPKKLFNNPYSTVLVDRHQQLLSASIAPDGQWRFPALNSVPEKFEKALVLYEDKRFRHHPGVDVLSLGRAIKQNIQSNKIISGGSTIDMQVIRLSRKGKGRTIVEKIIESVLATRLQWRYTKDEILALYASHAPFGGNVVGLEAACWRYFGREPEDLSWAEAAMLAVLPNAPALIHISKNRDKLLQKRNKLLKRLQENNTIDEFTYQLAIEEPIPDEPLPLPRQARHLLTRAAKEGYAQTKINSTIESGLQQRVQQILEDHHQRLKGNEIYNACAIVLDVETGNVLAYVGNVDTDIQHGCDVDVIGAQRSTGSILKPFLYAAMIDDGKLLPKMLLPDVPTVINGFAPKNFSREYDGAVPADQALIRSLNIPAVHMLREYRYERFYKLLKSLGMTTLYQQPNHYGLSLILGGAEGTLWDITGMYASMARTLNHYFNYPGKNRYVKENFRKPSYLTSNDETILEDVKLLPTSILSAASIYHTVETLKEVYRPGEESGWKLFSSSKKIAWKTGTSFGFRDGWAVGITPKYAVGVWVGNADGEGRPGLTGTETAAPVLFDIFSQLPTDVWFSMPRPEMKAVQVCQASGYLKSQFCETADTVWVAATPFESKVCTYHTKIHVSPDRKFRVHSKCEPIDNMVHANWFVLPPVQEYYYKPRHLSYKSVPPFRSDCQSATSVMAMELVYPKPNARIFIPRELNGSIGTSVFELAHRNPLAIVYWHLNGEFIGETRRVHHMAVNPGEGHHALTIVDDSGEILERTFDVISKM
jgi:penicillin-binding protein 1C